MPKLTIDHRDVDVPDGATVLDAAERLGIEIPTLCFLKGYEPSASCQVCMVKDCQTGRLVPACATMVTDGMEIASETDEVREVRRTALELLFSDHVGDCLAPCYFACPAHMDIPLMLQQIGDHEVREAIATIKKDIALPAVLGRVCSKPCERGCRRNAGDGPVAVCDLKRFVADVDLACEDPYVPECEPSTGKQIAIVGGGPAGLSAAYYLRQKGHSCTIFDDHDKLGGRLKYEVGEAELPRDVLEAEIEQVIRLGVELRLSCRVDSEQQLADLQGRFDAVLLACGPVDAEQIERWGLKPGRRGLDIDRENFTTGQPGVFAAGNVVRRDAPVVRNVADGKEAAAVMDQFLCGKELHGPRRPFSSRMGKVGQDEMPQLMIIAAPTARQAPTEGIDYNDEQAAGQSDRCLSCGCLSHGSCKLETYAIAYGADPTRFAGQRRPYEVLGRPGSVLFEPGKCIKCELCVKIATEAGEPLGLSFVGRGFDVQLSVPFGHDLDEGLSRVAAECVAACPTAALSFGHHPPATTTPEASEQASGSTAAVPNPK